MRFTRAEWKAALYSLVGSGTAAIVVNDPFAEQRANHKAIQLRTSQAVGLRIPRTLITNDYAEARQFHLQNTRQGKRTIFKPLTPPLYQLGEARVIHSIDCIREGLHLAPLIMQECIERGVDVRIAAVQGEMLGGSIAYEGDFEDWRMSVSPRYKRYSIDPRLHES